MARRDALIYAVGETPLWPGEVNPRNASVAPTLVGATAGVGAASIVASTPGPARSLGGLTTRVNGDTDSYASIQTISNNNSPADHMFLKIPWSAINPSNGVFNWAMIDGWLSNFPNTTFTLRIQAGDVAPQWVKDGSGGEIRVWNNARGLEAFVCRWWTPFARTAWQNMINAAGARYDQNYRIQMVSCTLGTSVFSEPFILGGDPDSAIRLFNAGLTGGSTVMVQSIKDNVADTIAAFPNTMVELAVHDTLQYPKADGTGIAYSWPVARQLMIDVCTLYGGHLCITDYGLGTTDTLAAHPANGGTPTTEMDVYAWMRQRHTGTGPWAALTGPVGIQLTMNGKITGPDHVLACDNAVNAVKAQHVETASFGVMTFAERQTADNALKANVYTGGW